MNPSHRHSRRLRFEVMARISFGLLLMVIAARCSPHLAEAVARAWYPAVHDSFVLITQVLAHVPLTIPAEARDVRLVDRRHPHGEWLLLRFRLPTAQATALACEMRTHARLVVPGDRAGLMGPVLEPDGAAGPPLTADSTLYVFALPPSERNLHPRYARISRWSSASWCGSSG